MSQYEEKPAGVGPRSSAVVWKAWVVESESLSEAVAESIEKDISAGNSWQVILKDDGKPEWISVENGVITVEAEKEPMTTAAQRAEADALAIVPDDSQL